MKPFKTLSSQCILIPQENIDTDQIIPAQFLKTTSSKGLGGFLFYNRRFDVNGKSKANKFDDSNHQTHKILITGGNFGCGSSREHAVWALMDFGFTCIISSSFGDIFANNALKNGLLPITLTPKELHQLVKIIEKNPDAIIEVDLEKERMVIHTSPMTKFNFPIDPFRKLCLLKGVDDLGYILSFEKEIQRYESKFY
jgi:3-isopropylmalate/(R)-2-methylmalate dehydratase small subunit